MEQIFQNQFHPDWKPLFGFLTEAPLTRLFEEWHIRGMLPEKEVLFKPFSMSPKEIKAVIFGNQPYFIHNRNNGLAYGIKEGLKVPPATWIVNKEMLLDNVPMKQGRNANTLEHLPPQGVFLLNLSLTCQMNYEINHLSHWRYFVRRTVKIITDQNPCIWMLWGINAQQIKPYLKDRIDANAYNEADLFEIPSNSDFNYILEAAHPSSRTGFSGCKHFYKANEILKRTKSCIIEW